MSTIKFGTRQVGAGFPVMVIAEIGVNHDGIVGRALDLVRHAKNAGADAVKLQIFDAATLLHSSSMLATYQRERTRENTAIKMLQKCQLKPEELERVVLAIRGAGMIPIATPFSTEDIATISKLGLPVIKVASPDLVNKVLLRAVADTALPMIVSTGAATIEEIQRCVGWLEDWKAKAILLHCISSYPTDEADANLCWIDELARQFNLPVGYSDHTIDLLCGALAVACGACVIEKHLTYDKSAPGPDHASSANPADFRRYVEQIRVAETLRGRAGKQVLACEKDSRRVARQSLVAIRFIDAGEPVRFDDLTVKRPGTGVPAAELETVVGRRAKRAIEPGTLLQWDMLGEAA